MLKFYEKRSWRAAVKTWWFVGVLGVICLLLAVVVFNRYTIEREMAARRIEAEERIIGLQERKEAIEDKVEYLGSERGIEAEMRRNFDVAQPGEQVVIILDEETDESVVEPLSSVVEDTPPWYIFWR